MHTDAQSAEQTLPSHAILDANSRYKKARKIAAILPPGLIREGNRFLEIGSGSGFIAQYFSSLGFGILGTFAVDVRDERQTSEGFQFKIVSGTKLPYQDAYFDAIVSNHVIEHVGGLDDQIAHLMEANRCLKRSGTLYLAVPNRWALVEPHYRLPFLSWLPRPIANAYLRAMSVRHDYDCRPLTRSEAIGLLVKANFVPTEETGRALKALGELEPERLAYRLAGSAPGWALAPVMPFIPTLVFTCEKLE